MKKLFLFLRDGKLFYGSSLDDATALEVVNSDANIQLALGLALGGFVQHEQLYDLPQGWTVEYSCNRDCQANEGDCCHPSDCARVAHLIPLKEPHPDQSNFETEEEYFEACRKMREAGIVATGIPEYGENSDKYIPQTEVDPAFTTAQLREKLREAHKEIDRLKSVSPPPQAESRHKYEPEPEHPQFCRQCGYAEHVKLKHF